MAAAHRNRIGWDVLGADLLHLIFRKLPVLDLLCGASLCCSSWRDASKDTDLWRHLDMGGWDESAFPRIGHLREPVDVFRGVLAVAVGRGRGLVESVLFPWFAADSDLIFVAQRCPKLCYFYLQNAEVSVDRFCEAISELKFLKGMGVHTNVICDRSLNQIATCCKNFTDLKIITDNVDMNMAMAICKALPDLRKLELTDCEITQRALLLFLDQLRNLEHLDISGYRSEGIIDAVLQKASQLKVFLWATDFWDAELKELGFL